jgi:hypothetical protein
VSRTLEEGENVTFRLGANTRNVRRKRLRFDINEVTIPFEPPTKKTRWNWIQKVPAVFKFVDDGTIFAKVNMYHAEEMEDGEGRKVRMKRDVQTENIFGRTMRRAEEKGMKINVSKTAMLAISDSYSYTAKCFIETGRGERLESKSDPVRILGFYFDSKPSVETHIDMTIKKARRRYWVLRHLGKHGFDQTELVKVYQSIVRSVIEYCSVVYHSLLTAEMSAALERVQYQALKCIFGYEEPSYRILLQRAGLETLEQRRLKAIDKFIGKCLQSQYVGWFPLREGVRHTRNQRPYVENYARCERLKNSPLFFMRRRLNDQSVNQSNTEQN